MKRYVEAINAINADEVNFLWGKETIEGWKTKVDMKDNKLEFTGVRQ